MTHLKSFFVNQHLFLYVWYTYRTSGLSHVSCLKSSLLFCICLHLFFFPNVHSFPFSGTGFFLKIFILFFLYLFLYWLVLHIGNYRVRTDLSSLCFVENCSHVILFYTTNLYPSSIFPVSLYLVLHQVLDPLHPFNWIHSPNLSIVEVV